MKALSRLGDRSLMLLAAGAAAALRLAYLATASGGYFQEPVLDSDTNREVAQRLLAGPLGEPFWQPPLYPWLLSLLLRLTPSLWPPRLLLAALSCGTAAMTVSMARAAGLRKAPALLAGLAVAAHGPLLFYDSDLLPTSLGVFLSTAALWVSLDRRDDLPRAALAGALAGLAALAVGTLALLLPAVAFFTGKRGADRARYAGVALLCFALPLSPAVAHNRQHQGGTAVALSGGINLWIGNNPAIEQTTAIRPGAAWQALADEPGRVGKVKSPREYDEYFTKKARSFCASSPARCAANLLTKARLLASSIEIPRNESIYVAREQSPVLGALVFRLGPAGFPWVVLGPLAAAGLAWFARKDEEDEPGADAARLLAAALLLLALGPVLFFVTGRYRMPMIPLVAVLAAAGGSALWRGKGAARPEAVAALVGLAFALWPTRLPVEQVDYRAELDYLTAGARQRRGDLEGAEQALRASLARRPEGLEAAVNLGLLLTQQRRFDEAERFLRLAEQHHPREREPKLRLAEVLIVTGKTDEAQERFDALLERNPRDADAVLGSLELLRRADRRQEALRLLEQARQRGLLKGPQRSEFEPFVRWVAAP